MEARNRLQESDKSERGHRGRQASRQGAGVDTRGGSSGGLCTQQCCEIIRQKCANVPPLAHRGLRGGALCPAPPASRRWALVGRTGGVRRRKERKKIG